MNYGYDGDWGNPATWAPYTYDYTEYQVRYRSTRSRRCGWAHAASTACPG